MLFHSPGFLLAFLPAVFAAYYTTARWSARAPIIVLLVASLAFYAVWRVSYLWLICGSIAVNYGVALAISRNLGNGRNRAAKVLTAVGIAIDLLVLAYFKYSDFLLTNLGAVLTISWSGWQQGIPLGISFFTFTQIAFLADCYVGAARDRDPISYALFVTYFPHLIAGPFMHHAEMMPQFERTASRRPDAARVAVGLSMLALGMFKKAVIADHVAVYADPLFNGVETGLVPGLIDSWLAALAYTLQIYFDFSGYSDMALGISHLFGVALPLNFNSPYKATSIIDFWRRWHMTLSRFLRDYLYIPLGGNRKGPVKRYSNVMITMLLGGLWHGAGWTFIIWGGLHGAYLVVNHAWNGLRGRSASQDSFFGGILTFCAVTIAWVVFRAKTLGGAVSVLRGMAGLGGVGLEESREQVVGIVIVAVLLAICFLAPNSQEIMRRHTIALGPAPDEPRLAPWLVWRSGVLWGTGLALMAAGALFYRTDVIKQFLYFTF